jgi:hypothetical protein
MEAAAFQLDSIIDVRDVIWLQRNEFDRDEYEFCEQKRCNSKELSARRNNALHFPTYCARNMWIEPELFIN